MFVIVSRIQIQNTHFKCNNFGKVCVVWGVVCSLFMKTSMQRVMKILQDRY